MTKRELIEHVAFKENLNEQVREALAMQDEEDSKLQ